MARLFGCACRSKKLPDVHCLNYKDNDLLEVPVNVFLNELTLEELYLDDNKITQLRKELFCCHGLQKLSLSHNKISELPIAIGNLYNLVELDASKNYLLDIPENIKQCKYLQVVDFSDNSIVSLPEAITSLVNLTSLSINVCMLESLPVSLGRLTNLRVLEVRENRLIQLPGSIVRLKCLERLDLGCNQLELLHDGIGSLSNLAELWLDSNKLPNLPNGIGQLQQLLFLDVSNNQLQSLPSEIDGCMVLSDLNLSENLLTQLPDSLGRLSGLNNLRLDVNQLTHLPVTIGGLAALNEFNISSNQLSVLPSSIGLLRRLRTFYCDSNQLCEVPRDLGSCSSVTVLSLRNNKLSVLPDELGYMMQLRVLNLSNNRLKYLPVTFLRLRQLQALWLSDNQSESQPALQSEMIANKRVLTCYLLPQMPQQPIIYNSGSHQQQLLQQSSFHQQDSPIRPRVIQFTLDSDHESDHDSLPKDAYTISSKLRRPLHSSRLALVTSGDLVFERGKLPQSNGRTVRAKSADYGIIRNVDLPQPPQRQQPYHNNNHLLPSIGSIAPGHTPGHLQHHQNYMIRSGYESDSRVTESGSYRVLHHLDQSSADRPPPLPPRTRAVANQEPDDSASTDSGYCQNLPNHLPVAPGRSPPPPPQLHCTPPQASIRVQPIRHQMLPTESISPSLVSDSGAGSSSLPSVRLTLHIQRNPALGFSIGGGVDTADRHVFVSRVNSLGPAANILKPGDRIITANGRHLDSVLHQDAVIYLKSLPILVELVVERQIVD